MDDFEIKEMSEAAVADLFEEALRVIEGSTPERAVQMLEDVLAARASRLAVDDPVVVEIRMYLGRALRLSGLAERAVPILRAAWADAVRATGPLSRLSFSCSGNLCRALGEIGEFEEAIDIALDAFESRQAEFGELDNGTLNSLGHIAHLQYEVGLVEDAVDTMSELLARRTEAFGEDDSRTESSRYNLAVMTARLENDEECIVGETLDHFTAKYGADSAVVVNLGAQLAAIHEDNGRLEEALAEWTHVEQKRAQTHGEVALPTLTATARKLSIIRKLGDNRVDAQLQAICHTVQRIAGPDHPLARWCADIVSNG